MRWLLMLFLLPIVSPCLADEYPTRETVEMVIDCMAEIGGMNEENLSTCACRHDVIASKMPYQQYSQAIVFDKYRHLPADKGAIFRDSKRGHELIGRLGDVRKQASHDCPVIKRIEWHPKDHGKGDSG